MSDWIKKPTNTKTMFKHKESYKPVSGGGADVVRLLVVMLVGRRLVTVMVVVREAVVFPAGGSVE